MFAEWNCQYANTYSGACEQPKTRGSQNCYYHDKVVNDLISTDEENVIREMPSIAL